MGKGKKGRALSVVAFFWISDERRDFQLGDRDEGGMEG
jgi:hypothetical protein